jgi:hypothetical protein
MMTNEIVQAKSFEDRLKDRIKEDIGKLLTDEELRTMVHRSVEAIFFKEREDPRSSWGHRDKLPPLLHEIVKECVEQRVTIAVENWINEHNDIVKKYVKEAIEVGIGMCAIKGMRNLFHRELQTFQESVEARFQQ